MNWKKLALIYLVTAVGLVGVVAGSFFCAFLLALMNGFAHDAPGAGGMTGVGHLLKSYGHFIDVWGIPASILSHSLGQPALLEKPAAWFAVNGMAWSAFASPLLYLLLGWNPGRERRN